MKQFSYTASNGNTYFLFKSMARNGVTPMFFFTKTEGPRDKGTPVMEGELDSVYAVKESETTGLPIVYRPDKDGKRVTNSVLRIRNAAERKEASAKKKMEKRKQSRLQKKADADKAKNS